MIFLRVKGPRQAAEKELLNRNIAAIGLTETESGSLPGYITTIALVLETKENVNATYVWFSDCPRDPPFNDGVLLHFTFKDAGSDEL